MPPDRRTIQIQVMCPVEVVGGGTLHARGLAGALRRAGFRVSLLCTVASRPPAARDHDDDGAGPDENGAARAVAAGGREWHEVRRCAPVGLPFLWRYPPLGTAAYWLRAVRRAARGADAVIALSPLLAAATRVMYPRVPLLYCPTVLDCLSAPRAGRLTRCVERFALRRADAVLFPAHATRDAVERCYGPLPRLSAICPLGVDAARLPSGDGRARERLGIPAGAKLLLSVGTVEPNKGQLALARCLAAGAGPDWWWAVVGDGPDLPAVRSVLRGSPLASRTRFVGHEPRPADWFAAADLFLAASRRETFGLAIAEALRAGVPVVIPRDAPGRTLSPLAGFVESRGVGLTFDLDEPASLRIAAAAILGNEALRVRMSRRAAKFARVAFSWERYAAQAIALLNAVTRSSDLRSAQRARASRPPRSNGWPVIASARSGGLQAGPTAGQRTGSPRGTTAASRPG